MVVSTLAQPYQIWVPPPPPLGSMRKKIGLTRIGCFNAVNVVQGCIKNRTPTHHQIFFLN